MKRYIGVKEIKATPMNRGAYNTYRGWDIPADENPDDDGFLVEYIDVERANHHDHAGYITWSPKSVFERAYRGINGLTFGQAIEVLKAGKKVARAGWNGKGIFVYIPAEIGEMTNPFIAIDTSGLITDNPHAPRCTVPWLASQTDMLSEDWMIVD